MGVFDVVGPVMIGPSSSHTAGAARLGKMVRNILGEQPIEAIIYLYGSFAQTYKGHGTDKALAAGLLGFSAEDPRIREALTLAVRSNMKIAFKTIIDTGYHPNTAEFELRGESGKTLKVVGASVGGGKIVVSKINNYDVEITGEYYTLIAIYPDKPGVIAAVSHMLARYNVNIAFMKVSRQEKGEQALMIVQTDQLIDEETLFSIKSLPVIHSALVVQPL
ncbi:MAG: L-serine ammonia-lyase, iron-sulfur-dependent subunit beta [Veillonellales bacterium]